MLSESTFYDRARVQTSFYIFLKILVYYVKFFIVDVIASFIYLFNIVEFKLFVIGSKFLWLMSNKPKDCIEIYAGS